MKIIGPLMSKSAHGTVADVLTFSKRESGQQARFQRKQNTPASVDQTVQRALFQEAVCVCSGVDFGLIAFGVAIFGNHLELYTADANENHLIEMDQCIKEYLS